LGAVYGEFCGTFMLMFGITTSLTRWSGSSGVPAIVFGFLHIGLIYTFSAVSGSHQNPAVSFATWFGGKLSNRKVIFYVGAQLLGSIAGHAAMLACTKLSYSDLTDIMVVIPNEDYLGEVFALEMFTTFTFIFVIFAVAFDLIPETEEKFVASHKIDKLGLTLYTSTSNSKRGFAPLGIGFTGIACAYAGGVFNPARVFGAAVIFNSWDNQWVYWIGSLVGSMLAVMLRAVFKRYFATTQERLKQLAKVASAPLSQPFQSPNGFQTSPSEREITHGPLTTNLHDSASGDTIPVVL